jgi:hypothetical protein
MWRSEKIKRTERKQRNLRIDIPLVIVEQMWICLALGIDMI